MLHLDRTPTMCVFFLLSLFERAGREQLPMSQWIIALSEHFRDFVSTVRRIRPQPAKGRCRAPRYQQPAKGSTTTDNAQPTDLILSFDGRQLCTWMSPDSPPCSPRRNLISLSDTSILFHTSLLTIVPNWAEYRNRRVIQSEKFWSAFVSIILCVCVSTRISKIPVLVRALPGFTVELAAQGSRV